ncbi:MAG: metallophosphoesterase [Gammaproteobacteria bacterium]|nr:metallophosphoesterase [Gammaproteobacteria bacterium]
MGHHHKFLPKYHGIEHTGVQLPHQPQNWLQGKKRSLQTRRSSHEQTLQQFSELVAKYEWTWPRRTVYFFSDLHADADALTASLIASGGVRAKGKHHRQLKLTRQGKQAKFMIGGDCFDKGPSNLALLRTLNKLHDRGAHMRILAGNHDVRVMLGMRSVNRDDGPGCEHFFVRMGAKAVPFLKEINDRYLAHAHSLKHIPGKVQCEKRLYPPEQWFEEFPKKAADLLPEKIIEKELRRIREKQEDFDMHCDQAGLSIRRVYAAALQWQQLFLHHSGEFNWFFRRMRLAIRKGSFLFVHAGLDNNIAHLINQKGVRQLNREFKKQLKGNPLRFYYGPLANAIRTKYRPGDKPLTRAGARQVHQNDLHVIIHGHKNMLYGQRISVRKSMVNFECDVTLDRHSREKEGLEGPGAGVTIIRPDKKIIGISTDHPYVKVFDPGDLPATGVKHEECQQ